MKITKKQKNILDFINGFIDANGYSPTLREIMRAIDYKSVSTVSNHVDNLVSLGYLAKKDNQIRSLEVTELGTSGKWSNLEHEISRRKSLSDKKSMDELDILRKALKIVKQ